MSRAEIQETNRARILDAAREEFVARGYRDAKVDDIAARADLTRGAVYSNFPGKRALYLEVLAARAEKSTPRDPSADTLWDAVGAFAHAWVARLEEPGLGTYLAPEVVDDLALPYTRLRQLSALLLGLAMERLEPVPSPSGAPPARRVRQAQAILTTLHGTTALARVAPGLVEPFDVISACEQLTRLELNDWWSYPHNPVPAHSVDEPWPETTARDLVSGEPVHIDGVVAVVGTHRLMAVEEALRLGHRVTLAVVTSQPAELHPLTRLVLAETVIGLRQSFRGALPLSVIRDDTLAERVGITAVSDATEVALLVRGGRIVAMAEGAGACHAVSGSRAGVSRTPPIG
ncbi:TetR/AcrR family transcriptional regulator [Actinokineospora cianjurensis]|uniref:TetR family transcriptional regulator n=1 Tax=Actinokineospora cianjurensis TaxID=585224 RepID=A0A421BAF2_9PSEU|nr:TetR/AcrR family transcriptional regulator [Actinokineospora cianjurensis]RLK61308.1 TetR family transcriptional regulator [Actinokineospora cianjurensis]